jgi:hypothetical protein
MGAINVNIDAEADGKEKLEFSFSWNGDREQIQRAMEFVTETAIQIGVTAQEFAQSALISLPETGIMQDEGAQQVQMMAIIFAILDYAERQAEAPGPILDVVAKQDITVAIIIRDETVEIAIEGAPSATDAGTAYYFEEDRKLQFTDEGLRHFTEEERNQLVELHAQRGKKFDEICGHLAGKLGYGTYATLSDELKAEIVEEAEELTEEWDSEVEMSDDPEQIKKTVAPEPELQTLLAAHHQLGERILDIQNEAIDRELDARQ